ncbi:unnamed protein product [Rhizoctonia solani]|uniref:Zn(2)-C6 fungal-type domain-containing protein n=1 Tax=Rhizoctonia solani TaxID=456999 RepID=A0A8H3C6V1_9AGAM|nr:unnamed protein product [Rhizoctonia solani]
MTRKSAPGPVGTSCLTCKQRHKKCDMRQPVCLKCEEGRLECLGYSHNRRGVARSALPETPRTRSIMPKQQETSKALPMGDFLRPRLGNMVNHSESSSSRLEGQAISGLSSNTSPARPCHSVVAIRVQRQDDDAEALSSQHYLQLFSPKNYDKRAITLSPSPLQLFTNFSRSTSPSDPAMSYLNCADLEVYFVSHLRRMVDFVYFKPSEDQLNQLNSMLISRLRSSHFSRWVMLLSTKISEAVVAEDRSQTELHLRWIGDIKTGIHRRLTQSPPHQEAVDLRGDWLEISLLTTALGRSSNAYEILRDATPIFLQNVYSLPELWSTDSDTTLIPLMNIIGSNYHALSSFTLVDCTCAMVFGLPQQVEYDTSVGILSIDFSPHEWAHGTPTEFHILLADINGCRDESPRARDWREIEHTLVHWESRIVQNDENWESWMSVAWLAVQESWRLALLAYLYLAVCRLRSDDERIQRCVTQILQVVSTVKKREFSDISVPFLIQYLIVGICARSEKHRKITHDKLSDTIETKFWIIRGLDFVPILDHLWQGAGKNGCSITWDDYVRSREAVLPDLT